MRGLLVHHPEDDIEDDGEKYGYHYRCGTGNVDRHVFPAVNKITGHTIEINIQAREKINHTSCDHHRAPQKDKDFRHLFHIHL